MEKVIGVGMHKTGTTSFGEALRFLGYSCTGWHNLTASLYKRGHIDALVDIMHDFDGFEDAPWYLLYERAYESFPNMKLVLTRRQDMDAWYQSLVSHLQRMPPNQFSFIETIYGTFDIKANKSLFIETHQKHIDRVESFSKKNNVPLLNVCWDGGDGWPELCNFLGREVPTIPFPHLNRSSSAKTLRGRIKQGVKTLAGR